MSVRNRATTGRGVAGACRRVPRAWPSASPPSRWHWVIGCLAAALCMAAAAQMPPSSQVLDEGLRRQEERSREQLRAAEPRPHVLRPEPAPDRQPQAPAEADCFYIEDIELIGHDAPRFAWLLVHVQDRLGHCLGAIGLSDIASALDGQLLAAGYATTRAALPPQNLRDGRLQVQVDAGRIAEIRMVDAATRRPDEAWGTWRNAFPTRTGALLNVRDVEHGIENMKRLPSQEVRTEIEPGPEPGTSLLSIERKSGSLTERLRGNLTLDKGGTATLGRTQLSANLALDNPRGLNDIAGISLSTNAEDPGATHRSQSAAVQYSVPWGYNLFSLSTSSSRYAQYAQGTTARFLFSGRSHSTEARLERTVWRSAASRVGIHTALSTRRAEGHLDDTEILVQRRRTTQLEFGFSGQHLWDRSVLQLDLARRRGVGWRGAEPDFLDAGTGAPTLRPRVWSLGLGLHRDWQWGERRWRYSAALRGQRTGDTTLSTDQMAIGGRGSVRGFDGDTVLLAESGYALRNELSTPLIEAAGADLLGVIALDHGRVWGPNDGQLPGRRLTGGALGVRARRQALWLEALLAFPLRQPEGFDSHQFNFYLTVSHAF